MTNEKRLIDANALETAIQGTVSQVALDATYDPEWFTRLAARQFEILKIIDDSPAVDAVEVVHGRWIHPKGYVVSNGFLCSECNHEESSHHVIHPLRGGGCKADENGNFFYPPKMNYCPNCGAKMNGDTE